MENTQKDISRLKIAGLFTISFFGYVLHMVIHNTMSHGMDPAKLKEMSTMMAKPEILAMFFAWNILTILPAFLAFVLKGKRGWWFIAIFGTLASLLNAWHSIAHIIQGDMFNGSNTFVMQMIPAIWAVVLSYQHARDL